MIGLFTFYSTLPGSLCACLHFYRKETLTMTKTTIFADRIQNISIQGNLVRMELAVLSIPTKENQQPVLETTHQLVMPLEGFSQAVKMQSTILSQVAARNKPAADTGAAAKVEPIKAETKKTAK